MEAYVIATGQPKHLEQWEEDLRAVHLPYEYEKGNKNDLIRLGVAKVQLYKIYFPEPQLDNVMGMIGIGDNYVLNRYPLLKKTATMIRKLLKLKPLPKPKKIYKHLQPDQTTKAVSVVPIGLKKDIYSPEGIEQI